MEENEKTENKSSRRNFLKLGAGMGAAALATTIGTSLLSKAAENPVATGDTIKALTTDGQLIEIDKAFLESARKNVFTGTDDAHKGIPDRKFVMVIDLAKCKNARKCVEACQHGHHLPKDHEWMRVYLLQDGTNTSPYWFPRPCFHCDNPMCVSVCPVGATFKRSDGIVLVDNERCIGCKFCMTGCPYSVRVFHWHEPPKETEEIPYSPEMGFPAKEGTVGKCVFCPDKLRKNELPRCATACPMGVIYFGDVVEDTVTNGSETFKFSELIRDRAGYRHLENLGTEPSTYYLPAYNRQFPIERGFDGIDEEVRDRYKNTKAYGDFMKNAEKTEE